MFRFTLILSSPLFTDDSPDTERGLTGLRGSKPFQLRRTSGLIGLFSLRQQLGFLAWLLVCVPHPFFLLLVVYVRSAGAENGKAALGWGIVADSQQKSHFLFIVCR